MIDDRTIRRLAIRQTSSSARLAADISQLDLPHGAKNYNSFLFFFAITFCGEIKLRKKEETTNKNAQKNR